MTREKAKAITIGNTTKAWWAENLAKNVMAKYPNLNQAKVLPEVKRMLTDIAVENLNACRKAGVIVMEDAFITAFRVNDARVRRCI